MKRSEVFTLELLERLHLRYDQAAVAAVHCNEDDALESALALFDMPNSNRFDILSISIFSEISLSILISISIFSKLSLSISISIFSKFADILTIDINIQYFIDKSGGGKIKIG